MLTQAHQTAVERSLQIINNQLFALSGLLTEADEKTFEELADIFSDCPLKGSFEELGDSMKQWRKAVKARMDQLIKKYNRQYYIGQRLSIAGDEKEREYLITAITAAHVVLVDVHNGKLYSTNPANYFADPNWLTYDDIMLLTEGKDFTITTN